MELENPEPVNFDGLSIGADEEEIYEGCTVELETGIELNELRSGKGVEFEIKKPIDNEAVDQLDPDTNAYFDNDNLFKQLNQDCLGYDDDGSENDNKDPFEKLALRMEDISPNKDGKIRKDVIKHGTGKLPVEGLSVTIHYNCYQEQGDEPYDSTRLRNKPERFRIGSGRLIPGMEYGLTTMRQGEISKFLIHPDYAFGKQGVPPRILPNATILVEIELLNMTDRAELDEYNAMSEEERKEVTFKKKLHVINTERKEGNDQFAAGNYSKAVQKYLRGLRILDGAHLRNQEDEDEMKKLLIKLCLNISLCGLKLKQHGRVFAHCRRILDIDPKNTKALYRKGKAHMECGEFQEAHKFLIRAKQQMPGDAAIARSLQELDQLWNRFKNLEKNMYSNMFPDWKKEPVLKEDKNAVSSEFKNMIKEKLKVFQNTSSMHEMPFAAKSLTSAEISFLETVVKEMNMTVTKKDYTNGDTVIKIVKPKPEEASEQ